MPSERNRAATVIAREGDRVRIEHAGKQLTVPLRGFPPGFELRPGTRVIVVDEPSGPVARPLVRAVRATISPDLVQKRARINVAERQIDIQPGTVVEEPPSPVDNPAVEEYVLWIVERADREATDQVIAALRRR